MTAAVTAVDAAEAASASKAHSRSTDSKLLPSLPENVQLTTLPSGVRVVTEVVPSVRSVALGLWVRTGSRDEGEGQEGLSHFLEHLLFKGTERFSAIEISEKMDGMGASANAATSKESTHIHARFLDEHTEDAFDLMAEMMLGPTFPDIDSEREVVLEEIAMYEDEPSDRVHDFLAQAVYGDHPLGRRVLGEAGVIADTPVPKIADYHRSRYVADSLVVGAAGHLDHERSSRWPRVVNRPKDHSGRERRRARARAARRFNPRTPSSTTSASARRASPDPMSAATHSQWSTPPSEAPSLLASSRGAREARPGLRRRLLRGAVPRPRVRRDVRRHTRGQRRRGV